MPRSKNTVKVQLTGANSLQQHVVVLSRTERAPVISSIPGCRISLSFRDLDTEDVDGVGRRTRYHGIFKPAGTNVNFIHVGAHSSR
jgi:hypothetical protein